MAEDLSHAPFWPNVVAKLTSSTTDRFMQVLWFLLLIASFGQKMVEKMIDVFLRDEFHL